MQIKIVPIKMRIQLMKYLQINKIHKLEFRRAKILLNHQRWNLNVLHPLLQIAISYY